MSGRARSAVESSTTLTATASSGGPSAARKASGVTELISAARSPWQNAYVERLIGSIRRECTDHIIPLSETHLLRTVREYQAYYNESRTHSSLGGNSPNPRAVKPRTWRARRVAHPNGRSKKSPRCFCMP